MVSVGSKAVTATLAENTAITAALEESKVETAVLTEFLWGYESRCAQRRFFVFLKRRAYGAHTFVG